MCRSCVDISHLAPRGNGSAGYWTVARGPIITDPTLGPEMTILNVTSARWSGNGVTSWIDQYMEPEQRLAAKWAYVNVTLLTWTSEGCGTSNSTHCPINGSFYMMNSRTGDSLPNGHNIRPLAVTCSLYPCVRRYIAPEIRNNVFIETQLDSHVLLPDNGPGDLGLYIPMNSFNWVKSPCRVGNATYTSANMSKAPDAVTFTMLDLTDKSFASYKNVTAPSGCTYTLDADYWALQGAKFTTEMIDGQAFTPPFTGGCSKHRYVYDLYCRDGHNRPGGWLGDLLHQGNASLASTGVFFETFATAMTSRYRTRFGASERSINWSVRPPLKSSIGIVQTSAICTRVEWVWLLFPLSIVLAALALLARIIVQSWIRRDQLPIWKDSLLAAMLQRDAFVLNLDSPLSSGLSAIGTKPRKDEASDSPAAVLIERDEIEKTAKKRWASLRQRQSLE